jgi:copper chaperone CopZ
MERSLAHAGVERKLATMVDDKPISMDVENKDQIAVRAGVVLADLVLTVKESSTERTMQRLDTIKTAVEKLGGGTDVPAKIDELKASIATGELTPDDLVQEFDELSQVMVPELKYEAGEWVVPLIQAGSWLEGAHLVSGAVKDAGKFEAANNLLRQPAVVDYFIEYVEREGADKAPDKVVDQLKATLKTLKTVAAKPDLGAEDVSTIHDATGSVLNLL